MSRLPDYQNSFRNIQLERRDGILQMTLHTDGDSLQWAASQGSIHEQTRRGVLSSRARSGRIES